MDGLKMEGILNMLKCSCLKTTLLLPTVQKTHIVCMDCRDECGPYKHVYYIRVVVFFRYPVWRKFQEL